MKINDFNLARLHNEEHFQFHTGVLQLIGTGNPATLKIESETETYAAMYANESEAIELIRKSALTDDIAEADSNRDAIFSGMRDTVKAAENHFNADKRQAAFRLMVVFDHYGNLAIKGYDEETASVTNLVNDLTTTNAADVAALGVTEWVTELKSRNDDFDGLKNERYTEESEKTSLRMKVSRVDTDNAYKVIIGRINALIIVEGDAAYAGFVNELNVRIGSYSNLLAQRQGRNAKNAEVPDAPTA